MYLLTYKISRSLIVHTFFQECICCKTKDQELYTGIRYRCHRTHRADNSKHNKLCKTCATDPDHPFEKSVTNNCIDHCRYHGGLIGRESAA